MIVAFQPELNLDRIIILRSYAHTIEQLRSLNYFSREEINFIESCLIKMSKDMALEVSKRGCKNNMEQIFSIESAFVKITLLRWFNKKFKISV